MTRPAVHEYATAVRPRYLAAARIEKQRILDEFCRTTGMHRKAAIRLLNRPAKLKPLPPGRPQTFLPETVKALVQLWQVGDRMCGKLLKSVLPDLLRTLERFGEITPSQAVRAQLLQVSAASIDRLLRPYKRPALRQPLLRRSQVTLLKQQVPIRTWSEWSGAPPGSMQADLVLHCGDSTEGFYLTTLCGVDVATGWTELEPVWGMRQQRVGTAVHHVKERLPFVMRSLHTDNGSEFINQLLFAWCQREKIAFSRGRAYRKNDQAYVEQRNWLTVRRHVGYDRLASKQALALLQKLYPLLTAQLNFFRPVRKLAHKERQGARLIKHYDQPRTPYQRLLASGCLSAETQAQLEQLLLRLNPAELQRRIDSLLRQLWRLGQQRTHAADRQLG